jgi:type IV pilus assembly protein PilA
MKSDFKTKLIQHMLNKKNGEKGFTLIELLVVIIIIGILAAIALPSFLNQTSKAKQTEAKTYVSTAIKAQQAYYTEKTAYAPGLANLSLGTPTTTDNYGYDSVTNALASGSPTNAYVTATSTKATLKSYSGVVYVFSDATSNQVSQVTLFENLQPASSAVAVPTVSISTAAVATVTAATTATIVK